MSLYENYKDDVLNTSVNEKRKFRMIDNGDGTVSFEDVTSYTQVGDIFGAADVNEITKLLNSIDNNVGSYKIVITQLNVQTYVDKSILEEEFVFNTSLDGAMAFVQICKGSNDSVITNVSASPRIENGKLKVSIYSDGAFSIGDSVKVSILIVK